MPVLDPVFSPVGVAQHHGYAVFDTLYGMDENFKIQPQMAQGHEVSADGLTWTIKLREGLLFHDGEPVRGRDVVASINRWSKGDAFGQTLFSIVQELSAPSDDTIVFRLKRPFPMLPNALGKPTPMLPIMPERLALTEPSKQVAEVIGSGPFRFVKNEWVSGSRVVYERFDRYKPRSEAGSFTAGRKEALVDRVEWSIIPDSATAASAIMAGEVDVWHNAQPDFIQALETSGTVRVEVGKISPTTILRFNQLQPPFNDPKIRQAVLPAINQADVMIGMRGADPSRWVTGVGFFHPMSPMANSAGMDPLKGPPDLEKARKLLAASSYDGRPIVILDPVDQAHLHGASLVIGKMLERIGFKVDMQTMDWGTLVQRRTNKGPVQQGGWNIFVTGLNEMMAFDPVANIAIRGNGEKAYVGWPTSQKLEDLRDKWIYAPDDDARKAVAREMQATAFEELPYIPLGSPGGFVAISKKVRGFPSEFPRFYNVSVS
ncbi:ABC transporter substrate-binding protein [Microvirga rosea]|uniref:ABC transporter substrate-binding protein n=1 Tax=Microvirga rosea TaxID=2715425 RepID=UPI001D0A36ED|nr:ABC transporter substrate-binding protein [Microvirga rosea]MCB8822011.1 ABC transporter substrate-binding protein [Microvirga rosea]